MNSNQVLPEVKAECIDDEILGKMNSAADVRCSGAQAVLVRGVKQVCTSCLLIGSVFVFAGTKACQEDYDLGSQTTLVGTATPMPTVTATETGDAVKTATPTGIVTAVSSIVATSTPAGTPSPTPVATPTATLTPEPVVAAASVRSLLGEIGSSQKKGDVKAQMGKIGGGANREDSNWLGKAFVEDGEASGSWVDSDYDGFSDELEARLAQKGADLILPESRLADRVEVYDQDLDGFEDRKEIEQGLSPSSGDTDGDGFLDGLEVLAGSGPLNRSSRPTDDDSDGAPDLLEESLGLDVSVEDTDGDRLADRMEIVLSTDGRAADTDGDGISDGKEVDLGSDPLISDFPES